MEAAEECRTEAAEEARVTDLPHAAAVTSLAARPLVAHAAASETRGTRGGGGGGVGEVERAVEREVEAERGCSEARRLANTRQLENTANAASSGPLLRPSPHTTLSGRYQGAIKAVLRLYCSGDGEWKECARQCKQWLLSRSSLLPEVHLPERECERETDRARERARESARQKESERARKRASERERERASERESKRESKRARESKRETIHITVEVDSVSRYA